MRKSINPYTVDWEEVSRKTKEEAGWKCVRCKHPNDYESGHVLTVHHLDLDPSNNAWWNIPALCQRCHLHIQEKVRMDQPWILPHSEWFRKYVGGYTAHKNNLPDDQEFVLAHLDDLLLLHQGLKTPDEILKG